MNGVQGHLKIDGKKFLSCIRTNTIMTIEEVCKTHSKDKCQNLLDHLNTLQEEYSFTDKDKTSVIFSDGGKLFKTNCDLIQNIIIQEYDFSTKRCSRDLEIVYPSYSGDILTYYKGALNKDGIITPSNKEVECDGRNDISTQ